MFAGTHVCAYHPSNTRLVVVSCTLSSPSSNSPLLRGKGGEDGAAVECGLKRAYLPVSLSCMPKSFRAYWLPPWVTSKAPSQTHGPEAGILGNDCDNSNNGPNGFGCLHGTCFDPVPNEEFACECDTVRLRIGDEHPGV